MAEAEERAAQQLQEQKEEIDGAWVQEVQEIDRGWAQKLAAAVSEAASEAAGDVEPPSSAAASAPIDLQVNPRQQLLELVI